MSKLSKRIAQEARRRRYDEYAAVHKDLRGGGDEATQGILSEGFREGRNVNALPLSSYTNPSTIMDQSYGQRRAGDRLYLLPEEGVVDGPNGMKTQGGYIPQRGDVVDIIHDGQTLEDAWNTRQKELELLDYGYPEGTARRIATGELPMDEASRMARAEEQGYLTDAYHATKQDIQEMIPGYSDGLIFSTPETEFANKWLGKGRYRERLGAEDEVEKIRKDQMRLRQSGFKFDELDRIEKEQGKDAWLAEYNKQDQAGRALVENDVPADKLYGSVYPLRVRNQNMFDPSNPEDFEKVVPHLTQRWGGKLDPETVRQAKAGNYLFYETPDTVDFLKNEGYDSMRLAEYGDPLDTIASFDPADVRSRYAAFDPANRGKRNILGSLVGAAGVGALATGSEESEAGVIKRDGKKLIQSWHGTPHRFPAEIRVRMPDGTEQFIEGGIDRLPKVPEGAEVIKEYPLGRIRNDKIGTGEGAQAYGYGGYSADRKGTAEYYKNMRQYSGETDFTNIIDDQLLDYHAQEGGFETKGEAYNFLAGDIVEDLIREENPDIPEYVLKGMARDFTEQIIDPFYAAAQAAERFYTQGAGDVPGQNRETMEKYLDNLQTAYHDAKGTLDLTDSKWLTTGDDYFDPMPGAKTIGERNAMFPREHELMTMVTDPYNGVNTMDDAIETLADPESHLYNPELADLARQWKEQGVEVGTYTGGPQTNPSMYKMEIDADPDTMLHWDRPFSDQAPYVQEQLKSAGLAPADVDPKEAVQKAISDAENLIATVEDNVHNRAPKWFTNTAMGLKGKLQAVRDHADDPEAVQYYLGRLGQDVEELSRNAQEGFMKNDTAFKGALFNLEGVRDDFRNTIESPTGSAIYKRLENQLGPQGASDKLKELGIPGLQYFDGVSRSKGRGSHNYVMFDDSLIDIKERGAIDPRLATGIAAGTGGILGAGMLAGPEIRDTLQGEGLAGALDTVWGGLQNAGKFAWDAGTNFGAALADRENIVPTPEEYNPMTDTGRAVENMMSGAFEALADYKPPLRDKTLGQEAGDIYNWYTGEARPWLQENLGSYGTRLGEAGAGLLAAVGLPSKSRKVAGAFDEIPIREEMPGAGGFDPRYDPRIKEQERLQNLRIGIEDTDTTPIPTVNLADYVDYPFITGMTDLTRARARLHSVNDTKLRHPLLLSTGEDFIHDQYVDPEAVWANTKGAATAIAKEAGRLTDQTGKPTIFAPFRMAPSSADFSTNLTDLMGEYASMNLSSKPAKLVDRQIEKIIPGWPGILSPKSYEVLHSAGGDKRKAVLQILDRDARNEGGLGIGEGRLALAKPELVNPGTNMSVGNIGLITGGTTPISNNAFPMGILGEPLGQLDRTHGVFELLPELSEMTRQKGVLGPVDVNNPHPNDAYTVRRGVRSGILTEELLRRLGY